MPAAQHACAHNCGNRGIPVLLIGDAAEGRAGGPVDLATRLGAYVARPARSLSAKFSFKAPPP